MACVASLVLFAGCSTVQMGDKSRSDELKKFTANPTMGKVYVCRNGSLMGAAIHPDVELDGKIQKKDLALKPGSFQAPAWSPTGDELVLLTVQDDPRAGSLVLVGHNGAIKQTLAQLSGPAAFAWSPVGGSLAFSTLVQNEPNSPFVRLAELDVAHPEQAKTVAQANVLAFFWSPDGRKIAYFIAGSGASGPRGMR